MAAIRIPIISDFDSKGIDKATRQFEQLKTTGERAQFGLQKAAVPAALALVALGAAAMSATSAAIADAAAQDQLAGVLQRQTGATAAQIAENEAFISSLSLATATADDELRPALANLVNATGDLTQAQTLLRTAQDLAAATNNDLATASDAVAKAFNGQMKGLAKLDPSLRQVAASGASFDEIMAKVAETTGGAAARAADTTAGRMKGLQIRFGELQEEIGGKLLPVAEKLVTFLTRVIDVMAANTGPVIFFATAIGLVATAVIATNVAIKLNIARLALMKAAAVVATAVNFALATSLTAVQLATGVGIAVVAAATLAMGAYMVAQRKLQKELDTTTAATETLTDATNDSTGAFAVSQSVLDVAAQARRNHTQKGYDSMRMFEQVTVATEKQTRSTAGATQAVIEFGKAVKEGLQTALNTAKENLAAAQQTFTDFAGSVALGVKAGLSFADAFKLIDDNGKTFMENLREQVAGIKTYATNLQTLLARGLSQDALKYVLEAGGEAGAGIAAELVKGTTDLITGPGGINEMVAAAQTAADAVGMQAATNWYTAGVAQAQAIVDGLDAKLLLLTPKLMARMDKIAAGLARTVDVTVRIKEVVERIIGGAPVAPRPLIGASGMATSGFGGMSQFRQNNSQAVTVNVMGGLSTSAEVGQAVVNAIRAYNRSAGPANIAVA